MVLFQNTVKPEPSLLKFPNRSDEPGFPEAASPEEQGIRKRLGIPPDTRLLILFGESSHWNPSWLLTLNEYYRIRIRKILDKALIELESNPARIFSVECVALRDTPRERAFRFPPLPAHPA